MTMTQPVFPPSRLSVWPIVQRLQLLAGEFETFADEHAAKFPGEVSMLLDHCQVRLLTLSDFITAVDRRQFVADELNTLEDYLRVVRICARLNMGTGSD